VLSLHLLRPAQADDFGTERFGNLHREHAHASGRTDDQNLWARLEPACVAQTLQGGGGRGGAPG
jgi:hypothetical protein